MTDSTRAAALWTLPLAGDMARTIAVPRPARRFGPADFGGNPGPRALFHAGFAARLRAAWRRHRSRRCLLALDADGLKDIGISYAEAEAEANKPWWVA